MPPDDELLEQMKRWGHIKVARLAANDDGPSAGDNILAKQRDMALATRKKREEEYEIVGRDGGERRRFMAKRSGVDRMAILPTWAVDPVRSSNDADAPHERQPVAYVDMLPDELLWIDRALSRLARDHQVRALVLRTEFCEPGTHRMKAAKVEREYGGTLSVRQYRTELARALDWMRGRMAA